MRQQLKATRSCSGLSNRTKGMATTKIRKYLQPMSLALFCLVCRSLYTTTIEGDTVVFRVIEQNEGNGYNKDTEIFTTHMTLALLCLECRSVYATTVEGDMVVFRVIVNRTKGMATTKIRKYLQPMSLAPFCLECRSVYTSTFKGDTVVFRVIVKRTKGMATTYDTGTYLFRVQVCLYVKI